MDVSGIRIKTGIFQKDSLSLFLFCLSLCFLSLLLNEKNSPAIQVGKVKKGKRFNHLFYRVNLKLHRKLDSDLRLLLRIVKKLSDDIGMQFGLEKCAKITIRMMKLNNLNQILAYIIKSYEKLRVFFINECVVFVYHTI